MPIFFEMRPFLWLPIRMGLAFPMRSPALFFSGGFDALKRSEALRLLARYRSPGGENGVPWDEEKLYQRLGAPDHAYALHATEELLLISSPRASRSVNYTLLCGFFVRAANPLPSDNAAVLVRAACQLWKQPLYVYIGLNNSLADIPGFRLPRWARPSPMLLQLRDFHPERPVPRFDRFQPLDFDFG
jgi:hypothetical protein